MMRINCLLWCLLAMVHFASAQLPMMDSTVVRIRDYVTTTPTEKIYIRTNKEVFTAGETIWFSVFLVDGLQHSPGKVSQLVYAELIDDGDQVLQRRSLQVTDGISSGDFLLADTLEIGEYEVRAYTKYMRNFDEKFYCSRPIQLVNFSGERVSYTAGDSNIDLHFFPEGGELIASQLNLVAFKATDTWGKGVPIQGSIFDETGNEITTFSEEVFGMGKFLLRPHSGKQYLAKFELDSQTYEVPLPEVASRGFRFNLRPTSEKVFLTVSPSSQRRMDGSYVIGHRRGEVFLALPHIPGQRFIYAPLPLAQLPPGICHFTFFDADGAPQAERLFFNPMGTDKAQLTITEEGTSIGTRSLVSFNLSLTDERGFPATADLSISVLNDDLYEANKINIENYLLLSSDLTGSIQSPQYFFDQTQEEEASHLDLLMLTNGWKRFDWERVIERNYPPITYYPESGFSVEGQVVGYTRRNKGMSAKVQLSFLENIEISRQAISEEDGTFWFDGLQITDTLTALIKSNRIKQNSKGEIVDVDGKTFIKLKQLESPAIHRQFPGLFEVYEAAAPEADDSTVVMAEEMALANLKIRNIDAQFDKDVIVLEELEVEARRDPREDPFFRESILYKSPDSRLVLDSLPGAGNFTNVFDLIAGKFPGVEIRGTFPNRSILIRGFSTIVGDPRAMILIDGVPTNPDQEPNIDPRRIAFIDVLRGSQSAIYSASGNGVIAIYTKIGNETKEIPVDPIGFTSLQLPGYYPAKEFYLPDYSEMEGDELVKPDFRSTLYWNPKVSVVDGAGSFQFYTSDERGSYTVYVEGLTADGKIVRGEATFTVK